MTERTLKLSLWLAVALLGGAVLVGLTLQERRSQQTALVDPVNALVAQLQDLAAKGAPPLRGPQIQALLQDLPADGTVRLWVSDSAGHPLVNEIEPGFRSLPVQGSPATQILRQVLDAPSGDGFVSYRWPSRANHARLAYVQTIPQWDWVIGASTNMVALDTVLIERLGLLAAGLGLLAFALRMVTMGSRNELCS
ncbi:cache domain-containing protein [Magnetospira sp. QH-2]|uniref:cache domain-containing protein n=1 Tax=Magnetospira sp. (strain QH-2) TaxID=1288970 RepID=UPI0005F9C2D2|nr:cache domain-containing protein [Magnetospira sp. QH-2]